MDLLHTVRVVSGARRGSSRPILVETEAGARLVKLRGVPQGTGPLVAEIIVGALAESIGLAVPGRCLIELDANAPVPGGDDELHDVMIGSGGVNLGFVYLDPARDLTARDIDTISPDDRAAILWLDRLVMNPDRTARNPNLLRANDQTWLIDHGAALGFQYDWSSVTEATVTRPNIELDPHLFAAVVPAEDMRGWDELLTSRLTHDVLAAAVADVPDVFLVSLSEGEDLDRLRQRYVTFLEKRLMAPRGFLEAVSPPRQQSRRPPRG